MIPITLWTLPLVLLAQTLNAWLLLVGLRLVLGRLEQTRDSAITRSLTDLTDPVMSELRGRLQRRFRRPVPPWAAWLAIIGAVFIIQRFLVHLIIAVT